MAPMAMEVEPVLADDVEAMRELGVSFEDQIQQHVGHTEAKLQALMMAEFRRHFAAQYAGVVNVAVLDVKSAGTVAEQVDKPVVITYDDIDAAWADADADGSGAVGFDEIQAIEKKYGLPMEISAASDQWVDGKISKDEFIEMLTKAGNLKPKQISKADIDVAWAEADADGSGAVGFEEIAAIEKRYGLPMAVSAASDQWADGKISKDEFVAMLETNGNVLSDTAADDDTPAGPHVRLELGSLVEQIPTTSMLTRPELTFPVDIADKALKVSILSDDTSDAVVMGSVEVPVGAMVLSSEPIEDWYGLNKDGASAAWRVLLRCTYVASESFNVCHSNRFKLKVDQILGDALEQLRASAAALQTKVDQQRDTLTSLNQEIVNINDDTNTTVDNNKTALDSVDSVRQSFLQSLAESLADMTGTENWATASSSPVLRVDVSTASLSGSATEYNLGYFITVALGGRRSVTTTALNKDTPTWNTSLLLPVGDDVDDPSAPLLITLYANTPSGLASVAVACQTFEPALWLTDDSAAISVQAKLYRPLPTSDAAGPLSPDVTGESPCTVSMEVQYVPSMAAVETSAMSWKSNRHILPLLIANIREQLSAKAKAASGTLRKEQYNHTQLVNATNGVADIVDQHTTLAALDKMKDLVNNFDITQLTALGHVGGVRSGCLDAINKASEAIETMLEPLDQLVGESTVPTIKATVSVPETFGLLRLPKVIIGYAEVDAAWADADADGSGAVGFEEIQAIETRYGLPMDISAGAEQWADGKISKEEFVAMLERNGNLDLLADDPILDMLKDRVASWGQRLGAGHQLVEAACLATKEGHATSDELNDVLAPVSGRLHLHVGAVSELPISEIKVDRDQAVVVALVDVQDQTYETAPVRLAADVVINAHLVIDVLDLPTSAVSVRVCVCPAVEEGAPKEYLLIGTARMPVVGAVPGKSTALELPLKQATRSYATYGTVSTSFVFAAATDPPALLRSQYTQRAALLYKGFKDKIEGLEDHLAHVRKDQAAVSVRAAQLAKEKADNEQKAAELDEKIQALLAEKALLEKK